MIEITNLTKHYGDFKALDNLSLKVDDGQIFGLLGPNGSGKSTTINCILSLLKFDSGSVKIFGKEMTPDSYDIKSKIGVVFQDVGVFEELTVYENIDYFCALYIKDKNKRKQYIEDAIALVSIDEFRKFKPKQLSGGLLRRLNIACGIAHKPELIIFDEPTVAVDPQSRNNILEGIKKLNKDGSTIVYTSHYMEEVEYLCDYIVIIDKGKVIAEGTSESLKESIQLEETIVLEVEKLDEKTLEKLNSLDNLINIENHQNEYKISLKKGGKGIVDIIQILQDNNVSYSSISSIKPTLNDVFLELTGKELRD